MLSILASNGKDTRYVLWYTSNQLAEAVWLKLMCERCIVPKRCFIISSATMSFASLSNASWSSFATSEREKLGTFCFTAYSTGHICQLCDKKKTQTSLLYMMSPMRFDCKILLTLYRLMMPTKISKIRIVAASSLFC